MATTSEEWLKKFKAAEKDLYKSLAQKDPTFAEIDTLLTRIRNAFENLPISIPYDAETRLWDAHSKINGRYRKQLSKFHGEEGKRRPVEKRKLEKHYVDFIKSSMRFYRGHIQRLASQHPAIKDLAQVAGKLNMDTTTIDEVSVPTEEVKKATLQSCHATLIRLGDLSRYRETELKSRERNWGPATGYYELALSINKESGLPHNQMAVIALADGNHLRALYRLYRAQAVKSPHPSARNNLDIEFSKIIHLKEKNELFSQGGIRGGVSAERTVEAWFLYFHARCDKGAQWAEYEDAENELLSQLSVLLKDRPVEGQLERSTSLLQRVTLINIAAEYVARQRAAEQKDNEGFLAAYRFYEQLNLKTFSNLLHIMTGELAEKGELTSVLRRILPALRNYSGWLLTNVSFLVAQHDDPFLGMHIKFFWTTYAKALTSLAATFPVENLPAPISYMLSEDEDTIGFVPLYNDDTSRRYYGVDDELKPCHRKEHIPTEAPHLEMLFRVRELLVDGVDIAMRKQSGQDAVPLELADGTRFVYHDASVSTGIQSSPPSKQSCSSLPSTPGDIAHVPSPRNLPNTSPPLHSPQHNATPLSTGSPSSTTPPTGTLTARDLVKSMQRPLTATNLPDGAIRPFNFASSIWTPLPGETASPRSRPTTAYSPGQQPTSSYFNEEIQRQHRQLHDRSSSMNSPNTPSSWLAGENTQPNGFENRPPMGKGLIPSSIPSSPWALPYQPSPASPAPPGYHGSPTPWINTPSFHHPTTLIPSAIPKERFGSPFPPTDTSSQVPSRMRIPQHHTNEDAPRHLALGGRTSLFGAIGQTPPSGQGG